MEGLKVHIWHLMLWKFKKNKNARETTEKFSIVYDQDVITDRHVWN